MTGQWLIKTILLLSMKSYELYTLVIAFGRPFLYACSENVYVLLLKCSGISNLWSISLLSFDKLHEDFRYMQDMNHNSCRWIFALD